MTDKSWKQTDPIQIDKIIQGIRQQIVKTQQNRSQANIDIDFDDDRQSPHFYEALYQAWLLHNEMDIQVNVMPSTIPLIGGLITMMRSLVHNVVIFYVQQLLVQQKAINEQFLVALSELGQDVSPENDADTTG